jgi:hypothetical protein
VKEEVPPSRLDGSHPAPTSPLAGEVIGEACRADGWGGGMLVLDPAALMVHTFESPEDMEAAGVTLVDGNGNETASLSTELDAYLVRDDKALEGRTYLSIPFDQQDRNAPVGARFPVLVESDGAIEVRVWVRATMSLPTLWVRYGYDSGWAMVGSVTTGTRTSDDWVELSTGPIEPDVLGRPVRTILVSGGFTEVNVDGLEMRAVGPRRVPRDAACTVLETDAVCGTYGECIMGRCVDSAAVWGPVPPTVAMRNEYAQRLGFIFQTLHANREAVNNRAAAMAARLTAVAASDSPRVFHGGVAAAVSFFKDGHTRGPAYAGAFGNSVVSALGGQSSGALGVCFGVTELDLRGGGLGYTVFQTAPNGLMPEVQVGDILFKVDRVGLQGFIQRTSGLTNLASDPASDPGFLANDLPALLSMRASQLEFLRCESATSCTRPTVITVPFADRLRAALQDTTLDEAITPMSCDGRFTNAVSVLRPPDPNGYDVVSFEVREGVTAVQFDGVAGSNGWNNQLSLALGGNPERVLVDTRLGNGGYLTTVDFLVGKLRDITSPMWAFGLGRPWQAMDPEGQYAESLPCLEDAGNTYFGACTATLGYVPHQTASAAGSKVAWLITADISGNDYAPRMLLGRPNFRIFGPVRTGGAFGAIVQLPPLLNSEYYGGSIQIHDTRFATTREGLLDAPYSSGTGVAPDEVVGQKLSDVLLGQDTMLARARAWLQETP